MYFRKMGEGKGEEEEGGGEEERGEGSDLEHLVFVVFFVYVVQYCCNISFCIQRLRLQVISKCF